MQEMCENPHQVPKNPGWLFENAWFVQTTDPYAVIAYSFYMSFKNDVIG